MQGSYSFTLPTLCAVVMAASPFGTSSCLGQVPATDVAAIARTSVLKPVASPKIVNLVSTNSARPANANTGYESHPLWPAFEKAVESYRYLRRNVRGYSCSLVRQERVQGRLRPAELMTAKVRHKRSRDGKMVVPFSVYLKVLAPTAIKGREVLFVEGKHDGEMFVRNGGQRFAFVTARMRPKSTRAMRENRYPVSEFGLENLVARLIEVVRDDMRLGVETQVENLDDASIDGRGCTGIRVTHPRFDDKLKFHKATVLIDDELGVPVHYEAYDWPRNEDDPPKLLERYTYRDIRLNPGYSDRDFDPENPNYKVR